MSIALLSDLHNTDPTTVVSSLQRREPQIIAITGDILYGSRPEGDQSPLSSQLNVLPFLRECSTLAPTFLSLGNHEWMLDQEDIETISSTGVVVLDNSWVEKDGLVIAGLTSGYVTDYRRFRATQPSELRYPRKESISGIGGAISRHTPETGWLDQFCSIPGYHILLSHHPEYYPHIPPAVDLILSGHAHGGQWRIFGHGVWSPGQGWWPKYTEGVHENRMIISAGLSNTARIPRLFNPVEIVYIEGR